MKFKFACYKGSYFIFLANIGEIPLPKEVNRSIKRPKTSYAECLIRNSDIIYTNENKIKKRKISPLREVNGSGLEGS